MPTLNNPRLKSLNLTILFAFIIVIIKLFYWQIIETQNSIQKGSNQNSKLQKILPNYGKILSSDNFPLSLSIKNYSLSIYKPNLKLSLDDLFTKIEQIRPNTISNNSSSITNIYSPNIKWTTLIGDFNYDQKQQLNIPGLEFEEKNSRYYPEKNLAQNITKNLELFYKRSINGKIGFSLLSIDGTGEKILTNRNWQQSEIDGQNIKTSLNRQIQLILQESLNKGLSNYQAKSASGIIMEPNTGQIIAMAFLTTDTIPNTNVGNISNLFEPGSIFKPIVVSMALDTHKINTDFICDDCDRPRVFGQYTINNWDNLFHPKSTIRDIIKNSDNIGMSNIISKLGLENFQKYFKLLKLDSKNEIDLIGESVSPPKKYYSEIDLATASFGQGFAINEIQMIQAFNTIANNGKLVSAHLNTEFKIKPTQIFDQQTTDTVKDILKYAVENGAIKILKPNNLEVCAKSGTAQISIAGQYNDSNTIGSYIGFSPCNKPKFTMFIVINQPKLGEYGSSTAAPIWYEIAQKISSLL